ncbi:hypothetical protein EJ06DRAFT_496839 [Trichodelitschia bisporula]|uniref:Pyridoxal phosphate homeostasis protein n=1 Tax=Trichodelitschia bisporula TaxID=703511 RepID=A0A6G1HR06_9PEZI|nr:hypothetical protein EJ06DRAFT_496839 [Trichodelitschia bisporula]
MAPTPARTAALLANLATVASHIAAANPTHRAVRLLLVSKLKPPSDILALHTPSPTNPNPPSHFGENYVQELASKAAALPQSINWHFIGALQSNKCKTLAHIPNLFCVASVDSARTADALNKARKAFIEAQAKEANTTSDIPSSPLRLGIYIQVNTSGEASKSGVTPPAALELATHVRDACPALRLAGFMTIGAIARSQAAAAGEENEDFITLRKVRDDVAAALDIPVQELELSMGMSGDFEAAIALGSDEVRVGSAIFGARPPKGEAAKTSAAEGAA